jgi:hypothetical protein
LLAVALPRGNTPQIPGNREARIQTSNSTGIPDFDAFGDSHFMETIIGNRRQVHVFPGRDDSVGEPRNQTLLNLADH